ncbi:Reticulon-4 receptor, partial [Frankliniella fusca]
EEVVLRSRGPGHLPPNAREVRVAGCARVRVPQAAFADLPELRRVTIEAVGQLRVEPYGFSWNESTASVLHGEMLPAGPPAGLHVNITNASVPELPSFSFLGRLESVTLTGLRVGAVRAFAFASLRSMHRLALERCDLDQVESQAFKKFSVDQLVLRAGRVRGALPSRAFQDLDVRTELTVDGMQFEAVHSAAFNVRGPTGPRRVSITQNVFGVLRGEAFSVVSHGPVLVNNNRLGRVETGALLAISVDWFTAVNSGPQVLRFENNTLSAFEDGAVMFNTTGMDVRVQRVLLDMPCDCGALDAWGRDLLNVPRYPAPALLPAVAPDTLFCRVDRLARVRGAAPPGPGAYATVQDYKTNSCGFFSFNLDVLIIVALALGVALLAVLVLVFVCCRRRRRRRRRWAAKSASSNGTNGSRTPTVIREMDISDDKEVQEALRRKGSRPGMQFKRVIQPEEEHRMLKGPGPGPFTLVVPDGRVYRETELHVIVERAEPLRELRHSELRGEREPLREPLREREPIQEPGG